MSAATGLRCADCGATHALDYLLGCPDCGGVLVVAYDLDRLAGLRFQELRGPGIWRYAPLLPVADPAHFVSLGEGGTPLLPVPRLGGCMGLSDLWIKFEGANPTGSMKDRSSATALAAALRFGFERIGVVSVVPTLLSFLLQGGVFNQDLVEAWIDYKSENELDAVRLRPHPYEFSLYFDI